MKNPKKKMKNPMLVSTPHTYLMHCPQCMQDNVCMKQVKKRCHPLRRFGPAVVLGPADCERHRPSSIRSKRDVCSSTCLRNRIYPRNIFFMPRQMVDMKARESAGGSCCQKAGSSSSSKISSEEDSTGASSDWTLGVQTA